MESSGVRPGGIARGGDDPLARRNDSVVGGAAARARGGVSGAEWDRFRGSSPAAGARRARFLRRRRRGVGRGNRSVPEPCGDSATESVRPAGESAGRPAQAARPATKRPGPGIRRGAPPGDRAKRLPGLSGPMHKRFGSPRFPRNPRTVRKQFSGKSTVFLTKCLPFGLAQPKNDDAPAAALAHRLPLVPGGHPSLRAGRRPVPLNLFIGPPVIHRPPLCPVKPL